MRVRASEAPGNSYSTYLWWSSGLNQCIVWLWMVVGGMLTTRIIVLFH